jgi:hypothetical protein
MGFYILTMLAAWCLLSVPVGLTAGRLIRLMSLPTVRPARPGRLRPRHGHRPGGTDRRPPGGPRTVGGTTPAHGSQPNRRIFAP